MTWWAWMILGAAVLGIELFAIDLQFYLVFFGLSAILVGIAGALGVTMPEWAQWAAFSVLSLVFMVTFRRTLYEKLRRGAKGFRGSLTGESINIANALEPGKEAREEHRGAKWTVRNVGADTVPGGSRARVVKVDGLTLHIEAE